MKSILLVLAIVAAIFGLSNGTKIQKCDEDDTPEVSTLTVQVGSCDEGRCVLQRGKTYDFMVKFKAPSDGDNVQTTAIGSAHGFEVEVRSGSDNEACKSIQRRDKKTEKGKACPLKKGTHYIYEKKIEIEKNEFKAKGNVEWYLFGDDGVLYCFKLPVEIKD